MKVKLILTSWFKRYSDGAGEIMIEVPEKSTVKDVLNKTKIPLEEIGFVHLDGKIKRMDEMVNNREELKIYTKIVGG